MERMTRLSDEKFETFARRYLGTVRPVLLEHSRPGQPMAGFTDNYLRVKVADAPASLDNCIANVRLDRIVSTEANEVVLGGTLVNNG